MILRPPVSTRTDILFPVPKLFRSGADGGEDLRMRQRRPLRVSRPRLQLQAEGGALLQADRSVGKGADAQLRPLQVGHHRNRPAGLGLQAAHDVEAFLMVGVRSEEHTSELQSLMRISYAVLCLKKKRSIK